MKYRLVEDKYVVDFIKQRLNQNGGYCPSVLDSYGKEEFKCPCENFKEAVKKGETCQCGLYVKVKN